MTRPLLLSVVLLLAGAGTSAAQPPAPAAAASSTGRHPEEGRPFIRTYAPLDVNAAGQNWAMLGREPSLTALAARASALLYGSTAPERYVTAALADLDPATGVLRFVSAGHVDTFILRAGGELVTLSSTGPPLGLLPPGLPFAEQEVRLAPGDTLLLFSDGVPEAKNSSDDDFGEERLITCVREAGHESSTATIGRIMAAIDGFAGAAPQFDDITLLVVRRA